MTHDYDDIIHLPHHVSQTHPQMSRLNRAAQFAPFAALTGHEAALREMARATEKQVYLTGDSEDLLSRKMMILKALLREEPTVEVTFFKPDERKEGGAYLKSKGVVRKIREYEQMLDLLTMDGKCSIPFRFIVDLESETFKLDEPEDEIEE